MYEEDGDEWEEENEEMKGKNSIVILVSDPLSIHLSHKCVNIPYHAFLKMVHQLFYKVNVHF
jgi:hypothetical protein